MKEATPNASPVCKSLSGKNDAVRAGQGTSKVFAKEALRYLNEKVNLSELSHYLHVF